MLMTSLGFDRDPPETYSRPSWDLSVTPSGPHLCKNLEKKFMSSSVLSFFMPTLLLPFLFFISSLLIFLLFSWPYLFVLISSSSSLAQLLSVRFKNLKNNKNANFIKGKAFAKKLFF
jgi:hypothetical protein